jgi:uncharacterized OB-fold protein
VTGIDTNAGALPQPGTREIPQSFDDLSTTVLVTRIDGVPYLVGSVCRPCGQRMLGRRYACSRCLSTDIEEMCVASHGTVYSWTTVHVFPGSDEPVTVGYVDLADDVRTFTRLVGAAAAAIGASVQLGADDGDWWFEASASPAGVDE